MAREYWSVVDEKVVYIETIEKYVEKYGDEFITVEAEVIDSDDEETTETGLDSTEPGLHPQEEGVQSGPLPETENEDVSQ